MPSSLRLICVSCLSSFHGGDTIVIGVAINQECRFVSFLYTCIIHLCESGSKMKIDKVELSGLIVLFVGVILLAFTFLSAYTFLIGKLSILSSQDLVAVFGNVLGPLIEAIIRILYLGIMGWVGSILTIRAVQLLKKEREAPPALSPTPPKTEVKAPSKPEIKMEEKGKSETEKQKKTEELGTTTEKPVSPASSP